MKLVAIITARGGSKRIPRKNIKDFMGKPMISYAIEAAKESGIFDEIMVSTDDKEIAEISIKYGAKVPFMRSEATSNDYATTADVLEEVIEEYENRNIFFEDLCCIYPCVPLLNGDILKDAYSKYKNSNEDKLTPVVRFSFPIQRAFRVNDKNLLEYIDPISAKMRSQDLEPMYHDAGMFYFHKSNNIRCESSAMFELEEHLVQDIDNLEDWKMAEIKYKILKGL